jgi:tetratricopeptide (TPR) repeat protein
MRWGVVVLVVGMLGASAPASAKTVEEEVEELSNDAISAYKAGRYQLAVEDLTRAYAIRPVTALLYNLAKAYDKLNEIDKAYENYKRYADSDDAEPKLQEKARARMAIFEPQIKEKKDAQDHPQTTTIIKIEEKPKGPTPEEQAAEAENAKARKKTINLVLGVTIAAIGIGGIAAGIGLYVSASGLHDQFTMTTDETTKRQLRDDAQSRGVVSSVMYAVGGVALVGSLWFFYAALIRPGLEEKEKPAENKVSLSPWLSPQGAGMGAAWRF